MAADLTRRRLIGQAMELLTAMGAQGDSYRHHKQAFERLVSTELVISGCWRIVRHAEGMIVWQGEPTLSGEVRRQNGLDADEYDARCRELAQAIIEAVNALRGALGRDREQRLDGGRYVVMTAGEREYLGPPPLGPWVEDRYIKPDNVIQLSTERERHGDDKAKTTATGQLIELSQHRPKGTP